MAELVDAADSKSAVRKDVQVRFLFRALLFRHVLLKQRDHYSEIETWHGRTQKNWTVHLKLICLTIKQ